jgi:RNA polymerase sigma factor (sigma-70 family)
MICSISTQFQINGGGCQPPHIKLPNALGSHTVTVICSVFHSRGDLLTEMDETQKLLTDYITTGSEDAFRELVARYIDLVYSTALRLVGGDKYLAQDVAQDVFIALAQKANALKPNVALGGWLHQYTYHLATKAVRSEMRRRARETSAVEMNTSDDNSNFRDIAPVLDEAIMQLPPDDRAAILLRFFEQHDLRTVAAAIGSSEDAARMRINRALDKLQATLKRRGVTLSAAALAGVLSTHAVTAAPLGLATTIAGTALASSVTGVFGTALKIMATTKLKVAAATVIVVAGVATSVVIQLQTTANARDLDSFSKVQQIRIAELSRERDQLPQLAEDARASAIKAHTELENLRNKLADLRPKADQVVQLKSEQQRLQTELQKAHDQLVNLNTNSDRTVGNDQLAAKIEYCMELVKARWAHPSGTNGVLATNLNDLVKFLPAKYQNRTDITPDQFEIVYQGTKLGIEKYAHGSRMIEIQERTPWVNTDGKLVLVWASIRGSGSYFCPLNGDFSQWKQEHTPTPGDNKP